MEVVTLKRARANHICTECSKPIYEGDQYICYDNAEESIFGKYCLRCGLPHNASEFAIVQYKGQMNRYHRDRVLFTIKNLRYCWKKIFDIMDCIEDMGNYIDDLITTQEELYQELNNLPAVKVRIEVLTELWKYFAESPDLQYPDTDDLTSKEWKDVETKINRALDKAITKLEGGLPDDSKDK